jgi:hypothetical protein
MCDLHAFLWQFVYTIQTTLKFWSVLRGQKWHISCFPGPFCNTEVFFIFNPHLFIQSCVWLSKLLTIQLFRSCKIFPILSLKKNVPNSFIASFFLKNAFNSIALVLAHILLFIWQTRLPSNCVHLPICCSMVGKMKQSQASLIFTVRMVAKRPGASRTTLYDLVLPLDVDS